MSLNLETRTAFHAVKRFECERISSPGLTVLAGVLARPQCKSAHMSKQQWKLSSARAACARRTIDRSQANHRPTSRATQAYTMLID